MIRPRSIFALAVGLSFLVVPQSAQAGARPCVANVTLPGGATAVPDVDTEDALDPETLTSVPTNLVGAVTGVAITIGDCVGTPVGVGSDGTTIVNGSEVGGVTLDGSTGGTGGPGPSVLQNVRPQPIAKVTYGGLYDTNDGSSVYMTAYLYVPNKDQGDGDTYVVWQSGTATVRDHVKLHKFQSYIWADDASAAEFEDYSPQGDNQYEASQGVTTGVNFGVQEAGGSGGTFLISASRQFFVSHTKFGGDLNVASAGWVYGTRGGYRSISKDYRRLSRAYSHTAAWTFPTGFNVHFQLTLDQKAVRA